MRQPTAEQAAIVESTASGLARVVAVEAGAGTGKTSSLEMTADALSQALPRRSRVLYTQYLNEGGVSEARKRFAKYGVSARTSHSLALTGVPGWARQRFEDSQGLGHSWARDRADLLGISDSVARDKTLYLKRGKVMAAIEKVIEAFCYSPDERISEALVPLTIRSRPVIAEWAQWVWDYGIAWPDGRLPLTHDHYQKIWQLSRPQLGYDLIMLDEAQDTNPCVSDVVKQQRSSQLLLVGDPSQQLYDWRGAVDAMAEIEADLWLRLSGSFRFGPEIAAEANWLLEQLPTGLRLTGYGQRGYVGPLDGQANAVMCRTNAEALAQGMALLEQGRRVGLSRKVMRELLSFAKAGLALRAGRDTDHQELFSFSSWQEVKQYVADESAGADLAVFVRLVETYGEHLVDALNRMVVTGRQGGYDVVCCTVHRAKGQEWPLVVIGKDFDPPSPDLRMKKMRDPAFLRICYVAVTRAQAGLDAESLSWMRRGI